MPKDALTIYRAAKELDVLIGGRIDKVNMPDRETLLLSVHTSGRGNFRLLLSCNPSLPRAHLTMRKYQNPDVATGVLMYFRKRLTGAVITDIIADKTERIITFTLSALDELRERVAYSLAVELTGKCANIVFIENGIIGNCLRRVSAEAPGKRAVLVGLPYTLPNPTGRIGVFDESGLKSLIAATDGLSARAAVNKCVAGLSLTTVDELFFRMNISDDIPPSDAVTDRFIAAARGLYSAPLSPVATFDDAGKPLDFFTEPYNSCGGSTKEYPTLNDAMDAYYSALFDAAEHALRIKPLKAAVKSATNKNKKRHADALVTLEESERCETDRIYGELITANIYRINRGDAAVTVENWYDGGKPTTVKLDPLKTAAQNAAAYFKAYNKKKKAATYAKAALDAAEDILYRLDGISAELELCTTKAELDEVRAELEKLGLIKPENKKKKTAPTPSEPYSTDVFGATLLVGKNHAQNDRITRGAARTDTWLHVKDAHGSHAVLKTPSPTDEQITRAAEIAAYFSQARGSDNVAVDYTLIKFVYPHGGGRVEYKEYKTVYVKPKL